MNNSETIEINDKIEGAKLNLNNNGFLHFHPDISPCEISPKIYEINLGKYKFKISSSSDFKLLDSKYSRSYGKYEKSKSLTYCFSKRNKILITIVHD